MNLAKSTLHLNLPVSGKAEVPLSSLTSFQGSLVPKRQFLTHDSFQCPLGMHATSNPSLGLSFPTYLQAP